MDARLFLLIAAVSVTSGFKTHPFVQTSTGVIRGSKITVLGKEVHQYTGIPYAIPPVGDLRFNKPEPVKPWKGLYEATDKPAPCVQVNALDLPELPKMEDVSEDCLYLNLWVSHKDGEDESLKPIMVWIYGGGFTNGHSTLYIYDGGVLAAYGDVIVASMNYRLGIFGFLNAEVEEAPGNMGLWDQILALQWIKTNAKAFGGDPDRITLFGESAGSISVGLHLLSPLSQGLFTWAIMQSGAPYHSQWGGESPCSGPVKGDKMARAVGCSNDKKSLSTHPHEVVECLRSKDAPLLAEVEAAVFGKSLRFLPRFGDEFLPHRSIASLRDGNFNSTNILAGVTSNEGALFLLFRDNSFFADRKPSKWTVKNAEEYIEKFCTDMSISKCRNVLDHYLSGISDGDKQAIAEAIFDVQGDFLITCSEVFFAESFSKFHGGETYFYVMDYRPSFSIMKPWIKMTHFEDVPFVFGLPLRMDNSSKLEVDLSLSIMKKWVAFAKTGNPNVPGYEQWPRFTLENRAYLEIKGEQENVRRGLDFDSRCSFWKNYFV